MTTPEQVAALLAKLSDTRARIEWAEHESNCEAAEDGDICTCIISDLVDLVADTQALLGAGRSERSELTTLELHLLDASCVRVAVAFGRTTYLVGTAETGGPYRDVDVRTIVEDEEFDQLFGDESGQCRWELVCMAVGSLLAQQSGLPVDYQIQRQTEANAKYDGPRNPIGTGRRYAGGGDATPWTPMLEQRLAGRSE